MVLTFTYITYRSPECETRVSYSRSGKECGEELYKVRCVDEVRPTTKYIYLYLVKPNG